MIDWVYWEGIIASGVFGNLGLDWHGCKIRDAAEAIRVYLVLILHRPFRIFLPNNAACPRFPRHFRGILLLV
jgi:hypothetical protein